MSEENINLASNSGETESSSSSQITLNNADGSNKELHIVSDQIKVALDILSTPKKSFWEKPAVVPLLSIVISSFIAAYSMFNSSNISRDQQALYKRIETLKITQSFIGMIVKDKNCGANAAMARAAIAKLPDLDTGEMINAINIAENANCANIISSYAIAPAIEKGIEKPMLPNEKYVLFSKYLSQLFSVDKETRFKAYPILKKSIEINDGDTVYFRLMFEQIRKDEFNILGRSNCLSIIANLDKTIKANSEGIRIINEGISYIDEKKDDIRYAVGPQTQGWISQIKDRYK